MSGGKKVKFMDLKIENPFDKIQNKMQKAIDDNTTKAESMTQVEYDSLFRRSGLMGEDNQDLLKEERALNKRTLMGKKKLVDRSKAESLLNAVRMRDMQLKQAGTFKIGQQTGTGGSL